MMSGGGRNFLGGMAIALVLAIPLQPGDFHRVKGYIAEGDYPAARRLLEEILREQPDAPEAHYWMGLVASRLGDYESAIAHLMVPAQAGDPEAGKLLAKVYLLLDRRIAAEPVLQLLTRKIPHDSEVWSLLGRLYQGANRFPEAVAPLQRALELSPGDVPARTSLAFTQFALGRMQAAEESYRKAITFNAQSPRPAADPHASFAIFLLRLNRVEEAGEQLRRAQKINPQNAVTREAQQAFQVRLRSGRVMGPGGASSSVPQFTDLAVQAGLDFRLENSPTPFKHQIETMPGGLAVFDYNNDGLVDIYFTNGAESPSLRKSHPRFWNRLYRNRGQWRFTDETLEAGVQGVGYMMGAAAGDFNNDGWTDLFVVGVDRNILYRNNRDGTFTDITRQAGLDQVHPRYGRMWGIHGAWLDFDNDGWLDLFVVNYCVWEPQNEPYCGDLRPGHRAYCYPGKYRPLPNLLFRNQGNGTFIDVSGSSGIERHLGKGMGAAVADFDSDGLVDIFVANDTEPNFLFWNRGNGRFEEIGLEKGVAFNQFGIPVSGMGADFRDLDNDGRPDIFVTVLANEGFMLFRNNGRMFDDVADAAGISLPSLPYGGWSCVAVDLNNDGWKDLFSANSHALDNIELFQSRTYRQRNSVFQNRGDGSFRDVSADIEGDFQRAAAHRGAAAADFDNDGRIDLVVTALGDRPKLYRSASDSSSHWLLVRLVGRVSNRDGIGAVLCVTTPDGHKQWNHVTTSGGFACSNDVRVHFGLGRNDRVEKLEVVWPAGKRQERRRLPADQIVVVEEPS